MKGKTAFINTERFVKEGNWPLSMRLVNELRRTYLDRISDVDEGEIPRDVVPTGFPTLDCVLSGGMHQGHLIVLAGRPGMGKTALAQQIAVNVAEGGRSAIFYSLEMSSLEVMERVISRHSGISVPHLKMANLTPVGHSLLLEAIESFGNLPLLVDDASFDVETMIKNAKTATARLAALKLPPLGAIFLDYLQLIGSKNKNSTQIIAAFKRLARELNVAVVVLSQLSRDLEMRQDKRPLMSDFSESGSIEEDADLVLFIYRDEYYNPRSADKGVAEIIVAKNRYGTVTNVRLVFVGERILFRDIAYK
jgi:replicative DNA helicase